jgi:hypothetical protein
MKKIIACISLVFAMSAGVTALAADTDYNKVDNSYSTDATGFKTVLIEDASANILYVNQDDNGLSSTAKFLLKGDTALADGTYKVTLGGHDTAAAQSKTFTISSKQPVITEVTVMGKEEIKDAEGNVVSYNVGCKAQTTLDKCAYVVVTAVKGTETKVAYYKTDFTGEGTVNVGIKITGVPNDVNVTVGLSDYKPE